MSTKEWTASRGREAVVQGQTEVPLWQRWHRLIAVVTRQFAFSSPTAARLQQARAGLKAALARLPDRVTHS